MIMKSSSKASCINLATRNYSMQMSLLILALHRVLHHFSYSYSYTQSSPPKDNTMLSVYHDCICCSIPLNSPIQSNQNFTLWSNRVFRVYWPSFYIGIEVISMEHFDFKDLMAFGMFILTLLTFIYLIFNVM